MKTVTVYIKLSNYLKDRDIFDVLSEDPLTSLINAVNILTKDLHQECGRKFFSFAVVG